MASLLRLVLTVILSLWLGGIVWLMAGVQTLFHTNRGVAVEAAPMLFRAFEWYQVGLGVAAMTFSLVLWRRAKTRGSCFLAGLTIVAFALALVSSLIITPHVDALRLAGQGGTPQFKTWHGVAILLYCSEAGLLVTGVAILSLCRLHQARHVEIEQNQNA